MNKIHKLAATDQDFEQSFFQLAYQQLQDKLGNLLPFLVGFELVQKEQDGTKALGVFGFRSNNGQILYVPAFFINGTVKGLDLLYSKNHQQFYPLNEDFADMFLKDDVSELGNASQQTREDVQKDMPAMDLMDLVRPPRTGKYSFAEDTNEENDSLLLDYLKTASSKEKEGFMQLMEKYSEYTEAVLSFYPMDKLAEALAEEQKPGKSIEEEAEVKVVTQPPKNPKSLTPENKSDLLTKGYVIIDKRKDDQKSKFGPYQFVEKFTNPQSTGFYPYITHNGGIRFGLVILRPHQLQQHLSTSDAIVVDLDSENSGQAYLVDATQLFTKDQITVEDYSDVHKMMEDINEVKPSFDSTYVLISESLRSTTPFKVVSNIKDPSGIRRVKVELYNHYEEDKSKTSYDPNDEVGDYRATENRAGSARQLLKGTNSFHHTRKPHHLTLVVTKKVGEELTIKGDMVYVPAGYKLLKLDFTRPYGFGMCCTEGPMDVSDSDRTKKRIAREEAEERWKAGKPGGRAALAGTMYEKNVWPLTVRANGSDFFVDLASVKKNYKTPLEAKIGMVLDLHMGVKEAEELIDSLGHSKKIKGYIKLAYTGSQTPYYYDEQPYVNDLGLPTTSGVPQEFQQPPDQQYTGDPTQIDKGHMGDVEGIEGEEKQEGQEGLQGDINQATQLAQGGQKEIFDTQSIATLAKYVSPNDKIQEYMPYLIASLDRLGRMLFLVHWEADKFSEMYGRSDMPELVELLTSVFKNLGDLVVFMKRKSPEISINMNKEDELQET
jgi:hypothetical protein